MLSVSQTATSNNAIAVFTDSDCFIVKLNDEIKSLLTKLKKAAKSKDLILVNGKMINGIYTCNSDDLKDTNKSKECKFTYGKDNSSLQTNNYIDFAGASYYTNVPSASVDSIEELVRFFNEIWNHALMELMCSIVKNKLILYLPDDLTK